jgi:hypothetical protein
VPAHKQGESIEGEKIYGHSRDPLRSQPVKKINGTKCFLFKAEFDVFAEIVVGLAHGAQQIDESALLTKGEKIECDTAQITTSAKGRTPRQKDLFQKTTSHITHTHGANEWEFKQQTNAKVLTPRQEIINALQKRNENIQIK